MSTPVILVAVLSEALVLDRVCRGKLASEEASDREQFESLKTLMMEDDHMQQDTFPCKGKRAPSCSLAQKRARLGAHGA